MQVMAQKSGSNCPPAMASYCTGDGSLLQRSAAHRDSLGPLKLRAPCCPQPAFPPPRPLFCLAAAPSTHLQGYNHPAHPYRYSLPFPPSQIHPHNSLPALQPTRIYLYNPSISHVIKPLVCLAGTTDFQNLRCPCQHRRCLLSHARAVTSEQLSSHREVGEDARVQKQVDAAVVRTGKR